MDVAISLPRVGTDRIQAKSSTLQRSLCFQLEAVRSCVCILGGFKRTDILSDFNSLDRQRPAEPISGLSYRDEVSQRCTYGRLPHFPKKLIAECKKNTLTFIISCTNFYFL